MRCNCLHVAVDAAEMLSGKSRVAPSADEWFDRDARYCQNWRAPAGEKKQALAAHGQATRGDGVDESEAVGEDTALDNTRRDSRKYMHAREGHILVQLVARSHHTLSFGRSVLFFVIVRHL